VRIGERRRGTGTAIGVGFWEGIISSLILFSLGTERKYGRRIFCGIGLMGCKEFIGSGVDSKKISFARKCLLGSYD